jgi:signal transduction histidine kinase
MLSPPFPPNETLRLATLYDYNILDTGQEQDFDYLTRLAANICDVPIALISLIDFDRQWFKSRIGMELSQSPRTISFCAHTILQPDLLVVNDASKDERFADNPFVTEAPNIRFYAGSPLVGPEGYALGSLCVIDCVPRELRPGHYDSLRMLSRQVVNQMRLRKAGNQLRAESKLTRATLDAIPACIATLSERGEILSVNQTWTKHHKRWGPFSGCGIGDNYLLVCDRDVNIATQKQESLAGVLESLLKGRTDRASTQYFTDFQSGKRWFNFRASRFVCDSATSVIIVIDDITEQKRLEALELERRSLKDAVASMEQVLGVVGHELRTPLAGLRALSDYLIDPASRGTPEHETFLRELNCEVIRMSDTVDSLLEAARLNSGRARWNWSEFEIEPICLEAIENTRRLLPDEQVKLDFQIASGVKLMHGDSSAIRRLLINLLSNARKNTPRGEIRISAQNKSCEGQRYTELSVSDTGTGIPPGVLQQLGEAFALNAGVVGDNYVSGAGLGLSICKGIVAAHGGWIAIQSKLGEGTTVTAMLRSDLSVPAELLLHSPVIRILPRGAASVAA